MLIYSANLKETWKKHVTWENTAWLLENLEKLRFIGGLGEHGCHTYVCVETINFLTIQIHENQAGTAG